MEVDWFTVIAQILNFLVLVWLLKRFLYKPVLNAIDEREKKIASELEDAAIHKAEARKEKEKFLQKNKGITACDGRRLGTYERRKADYRQRRQQ